jgi:transposase InsO family protein
MNAHVERFIQSIQSQSTDHFLVLGEKHFDYLVRDYHAERPHQGLGNVPLDGPPPDLGDGEIVVRTRLGGLLKSYGRAA